MVRILQLSLPPARWEQKTAILPGVAFLFYFRDTGIALAPIGSTIALPPHQEFGQAGDGVRDPPRFIGSQVLVVIIPIGQRANRPGNKRTPTISRCCP
jgi:hypothetical protein